MVHWKLNFTSCRPRRVSRLVGIRFRERRLILLSLLVMFSIALLVPYGHAPASPDTVTVSVSCSPSSFLYGATTQCTATLTDTAPTPNNGPPQGTVSFTISPTGGTFSPSATCTLATTGAETSVCMATYSPVASGTKTITGTYTRSNTLWQNGVTGTTSITVSLRTTSLSVGCSPNSVLAGTGTTCTVTVNDSSPGTPITPTGTVGMSSTRSGSFTTCTLSGGGATSTCTTTYTPGAGSEGSITITANFP